MFASKKKLILIIGGLLIVAGCAQIRQFTYPPEIVYIEKSRLQGSMHRMADAMRQLDALLAEDTVRDSAQSDVVEQLDLIGQAASELSGGGTLTNHLLLDDHMNQFSADVAKARLMAKSMPPNYYYAGRLSGSCSACHQFR